MGEFVSLCVFVLVSMYLGASKRREAPLSDVTWPNLCEFAHFFNSLMRVLWKAIGCVCVCV